MQGRFYGDLATFVEKGNLKSGSWILLVLMLVVGEVRSQDIHFSQFFSHPLYVNPANAGFGEQTWRFVLGSKSQWNSFTNAYGTYTFSADTRLPLNLGRAVRPAAGLLVSTDKAGDAGFGFTSFNLSLGAAWQLPGKAGLVSVAVMPGFIQYSLQFSELYFDSQFDGSAYNPATSAGEPLAGSDLLLGDLSAGLLYSSALFGERKPLLVGLSLYHLNQPQLSLYGDKTARLPAKWQFHSQMEFPLNARLILIPQIYWTSQNSHREILMGAQAKVFFPGQTINPHYFGLHVRPGDAAVLSWVFGYSGFLIGLSYDINLSSLATVSRGRGGFEFSLQYAISPKPVPSFRPTHICPIYI